MKYILSYVTSDGEVNSNALWHSFIMLSTIEEGDHWVKVYDTWSFYGIPTITEDSYLVEKVKSAIGLKLQSGSHGWFTHEVYRYLDQGKGLHGVHFEISKAQFDATQIAFQGRVNDQVLAVQEAAVALNLKPQEKFTRYEFDQHSVDIFEYEKKKAKEEGRSSRLKPFDPTPSMSGFVE